MMIVALRWKEITKIVLLNILLASVYEELRLFADAYLFAIALFGGVQVPCLRRFHAQSIKREMHFSNYQCHFEKQQIKAV